MQEPTDEEGRQIKHLYSIFGLVIHTLQSFERQLAISLVTVFGPGPGKIDRKGYDTLLNENFKKTLGHLYKRLKEVNEAPEDLITEIENVLKIRNKLIHRYFWENAVFFCNVRGRQKMIEELEEYREEIETVDFILTSVTLTWGRRHGVAEEDIEKQMKVLLF